MLEFKFTERKFRFQFNLVKMYYTNTKLTSETPGFKPYTMSPEHCRVDWNQMRIVLIVS